MRTHGPFALLASLALTLAACGGGDAGEDRRAVACVPRTCGDLEVACGAHGDGCGGTLDCGVCPDGWACTPRTCEGAGRSCGELADGCGAVLACGTCEGSLVCEEGVCAPPPVDGVRVVRLDPSAACDPLVPEVPEPREALRDHEFGWEWCTPGSATAGHVALGLGHKGGPDDYQVVPLEGGEPTGSLRSEPGSLVAHEDGWAGLVLTRPGDPWIDHLTHEPDGTLRRQLQIGRGPGFLHVPAPGGSALFFTHRVEDAPESLRLEWFDAAGDRVTLPVDLLRWQDLDAGPVTVGVARGGETLAVWTDGTATWLRWLGAEGAPLGPAFAAIPWLPAGTWRLDPLVDGSLALSIDGVPLHRLTPGSETFEPTPAWLRKGSLAGPVAGGAGYAVALPRGRFARSGTYRIHATDGTACAEVHVGAPDHSSQLLAVGADGTLVEAASVPQDGRSGGTCRYRWWPELFGP